MPDQKQLPLNPSMPPEMQRQILINETLKNVPESQFLRLECDCGGNEFTPLIKLKQIPVTHKGNLLRQRIKIEYEMLQCNNPTCGMLYWRNNFAKVEAESALILNHKPVKV